MSEYIIDYKKVFQRTIKSNKESSSSYSESSFMVAIQRGTKSRLSGYIVTALGRFTGAMMFIILDLYAFVIVNIIHTYIGLRGYYKNRKELSHK